MADLTPVSSAPGSGTSTPQSGTPKHSLRSLRSLRVNERRESGLGQNSPRTLNDGGSNTMKDMKFASQVSISNLLKDKSEEGDNKRSLAYSALAVAYNRSEITTVLKMIAADISAINAVIIACVLNENSTSPFKSLGRCRGGLTQQLLIDGTPFMIMDAIEMAYFVYFEGVPCYGVFFELDPFLVLAVVVVAFMNFVLLLAVA